MSISTSLTVSMLNNAANIQYLTNNVANKVALIACLILWQMIELCQAFVAHKICLVRRQLMCTPLPPAEAKSAPVFDVPLKSTAVTEGERLSLRCHVRGSPPLRIQWMKDRKELTPSATSDVTFSDGTACLEIVAATRRDSGDYICKATNNTGSELCRAKVTVKGKRIRRLLRIVRISFLQSLKSLRKRSQNLGREA